MMYHFVERSPSKRTLPNSVLIEGTRYWGVVSDGAILGGGDSILPHNPPLDGAN